MDFVKLVINHGETPDTHVWSLRIFLLPEREAHFIKKELESHLVNK